MDSCIENDSSYATVMYIVPVVCIIYLLFGIYCSRQLQILRQD